MDPNQCLVCGQPATNCFYSNRRAESFEINMVHDFEELVAVPCHAKELLNSFLVLGKWLIVECGNNEVYHMYVEKTEARSYLCGPYGRSLVEAYDIEENDAVKFTFDIEDSNITVEVFDMEHNEKIWMHSPECRNVIDCCKSPFERTIFTYITDITNAEMNGVLFAIYKHEYKVYDEDHVSLSEAPQFLVTRLYSDRLNHLEIPSEVLHGYAIPTDGLCLLRSRAINGQMPTSYSILKGQYICIAQEQPSNGIQGLQKENQAGEGGEGGSCPSRSSYWSGTAGRGSCLHHGESSPCTNSYTSCCKAAYHGRAAKEGEWHASEGCNSYSNVPRYLQLFI